MATTRRSGSVLSEAVKGTPASHTPLAARAVQRSQYLTEALRDMGQPKEPIRSGWELGARLLATAITTHAKNRADGEAVDALRQEENARIATAVAGLGMDPAGFQTSAPPAPAAHQGGLGNVFRGIFGGRDQSASAPPQAAPTAPTGISPGAPEPPLSGAVDQAAAPLPPAPQPQPPSAPTAPMAAPVQQQPLASAAYSPEDRDALTRMLAVEAIGEGPQGMAAAGHVALNRLKNGYGGAKSLSEIIHQPHQFEGITRGGQVKPEDYAAAGQVADGILSGQVPDPTNGAMAFLNPDLQVQLGRKIPAWAQGEGQRIGRHVFFGGQPQAAQGQPVQTVAQPITPEQAQAEANAAMATHQLPPDALRGGGDPNHPAAAPALPGGGSLSYSPPAQPFQVAASQLQPSMVPSGQGGQSSPLGQPQQGGGEAQPGEVTAFPPRSLTPQQDQLLRQYLTSSDPVMRQQGLAYAQQLQKEMAEAPKYEFTTKDGVPIWADPHHPGRLYTGEVPQGLRKHTLTSAEAAQLGVPPGTVVQQAPDGTLSFDRPSEGQMVTSKPGEPYRESYIPGSKGDPTRPQTPQQGYRYAGQPNNPTEKQEVIPGSGQDPRNPAALLEGTKGVRAEVAPFVQSAVGLQRNINAVRAGVSQRTGSGDIAAVTGLQKLIDEGVVQSGEMNNQLNAQGLAGGIAGITSYLQSNGKFDDATRAKIQAAAESIYAANNRSLRARVTGYRAIVDKAYGSGAFDSYVFTPQMGQDLGWGDGAAPPPQPGPNAAPQFKPGTYDAAIAQAIKRGMQLTPFEQKRARELGLTQ